MDTLSAFAMGQANTGKELMVFDWDKAAKLIKKRKYKTQIVSAGLSGDWEWTGDVIYDNGKPKLDNNAYLASTWAIPELDIDGERIECYKMKSETDKWDADTKWPKSALEILNK